MTLPAVIFDMDGLLLDTEKICLDSFVETRRVFALPDSPEIFLKCVGLRGTETEQLIRDNLNDTIGFDEFVKEWERRIQASLEHEIPVRYGAATLIQVLSEKGHALAVATSTDTSRARTQLETTGLLRHFEHVIGGDLVTRHKPDPEVYHKAAAQLGYLAKDCIAFEDSEAGTRAAVAAGARTVQVPDLIAPSDKLKSLGHVIAPDLLTGAIAVGLIDTRDIT